MLRPKLERASGAAHGWVVALPFLVPVVAALRFVVLETPRLAIERRDARAALFPLLGWVVTASFLPPVGHAPGLGSIVLVAFAAVAGALTASTAMFAAPRLITADASAPVGRA